MYNNSEAFSILISKINAYKKSGYVLIFYIKKRGNPENETKEALIFRERVIFTFLSQSSYSNEKNSCSCKCSLVTNERSETYLDLWP